MSPAAPNPHLRLEVVQNVTGEEWRKTTNSSRKNEAARPKKRCSVDLSGDENKIWCWKEQFCIGTWNARSMNQNKLDVVKQEMARVYLDILAINELKWKGIRSDQSLSRVRLFATPWITARQASLFITNSRSSPRLTSIKSVMPSSHLILCRPLLLLLPIPPSIRVIFNESTLRLRWPKYWSFSFSIIPSKEIPGLISFRMDWLDLLAVQGTLKESSPTPQFKSINSLALSFLHSPTLTSIHGHRKNRSPD